MAETKKLALVTGASSGIGFELAKRFADDGYDLVIAAEDDGITTAAGKLSHNGAHVRPVKVDLRSPEGVTELCERATEGRHALDAAAINAGVGTSGKFVDSDLEHDLSVIDLNVRSTTHLTKLVLRDMVERGSGKVLLTSSVASMMPGSYQNVYNATKSYVQSLAEAIHDELHGSDVTVTALMPGPTGTNFFHRAGLDNTPVGKAPKDDPARVADEGYRAMRRGDQKVMAGSLVSKAMGTLNRVLPDRVKALGSRVISVPLNRS